MLNFLSAMFPLKQQLILVLVPIVVFVAVFRFLTMPRSREASNSNFSHYQPLSSADYPRTYRISPSTRAIGLIGLFVIFSVGFFTFRSALAGPQVRLVTGILLIVFIFAMLRDAKYRVVLFADRIEVQGLVLTRVLRRDEIVGCRLVEVRGSQIIRLVPQGGQRPVRVYPLDLETDSAFWEWMDTLPDLDVPHIV
jgi:hypothetical protein